MLGVAWIGTLMNLERAIEIAVTAHKGQRDKSGQPYILHPLRVMLDLASDDEKIVGVLHDVIEDCEGWSLARLADEGFSPSVIAAVEAVTVREGETYDTFIQRASANGLARNVKMADLRDNMRLDRIAEPTEKDFARIEKYKRAMATLERVAASDGSADAATNDVAKRQRKGGRV